MWCFRRFWSRQSNDKLLIKVKKWLKWAKNIFPSKLNVWTRKKYGYKDQLFMKKQEIDFTGCKFVMYVQNADFGKIFHFLAFLARTSEMLDFFGGWNS